MTSASEIPGATAARLADPETPMAWNAFMIPHTVPNRPMNGVTLPVVARSPRFRSSRSASAAAASSTRRRTLSSTRSRASSGMEGLPRNLPTASATPVVSSLKPPVKIDTRGLFEYRLLRSRRSARRFSPARSRRKRIESSSARFRER